MATIELHQVEKKFADLHAVKPVDLTINDGEFVVLLGPSGCGKTTTLRMISGLEAVTSGQILIDGQDVTWNHPSDRDIAFVFQFFALYPHMTVRQNIAFTLEAQSIASDEINQRVADVAELLQIGHLMRSRPGGLSGGDRQRVALARALVRRPKAFLMDEPLGALDADFRSIMRSEIKQLHLAQKATTVYVTHDQIEAMAMGDRIVVMSAAEVQQVGTPTDVYHNPSNLFVAQFIGSPGMNLLTGRYANGMVHLPGGTRYPVPDEWYNRIEKGLQGNEVVLGFRPEAARLTDDGSLSTEVYAEDLHGAYAMLHLALEQDNPDSMIHVRAARDGHHPIGSSVQLDLDAKMVRFFDPESGLSLALSQTQPAPSVTQIPVKPKASTAQEAKEKRKVRPPSSQKQKQSTQKASRAERRRKSNRRRKRAKRKS